MKPYFSFVIPAKNEEGSVRALHAELLEAISPLKKTYEVIFIDDGSTDNTFNTLKEIAKKDKNVRVLKFRGNFGKSTALQAGFDHSQGEVVFTMDADLQDNPKEIPAFLAKLDEGFDLVSGWKKDRHDPWHKVIPSRILNWTTGKITGVRLHDINCGFKAYRSDVVKTLNLYGELYRFIPVFATKQGFRVAEIVVDHRARKHGKSKFGIERNIKGLLDLLTIVFLTAYGRRPGHFFGTLGLLSFLSGFCIGLYITYLRLTTGSIQDRHPLLFLGMLLMIVGVQLISTGLLAEMILSAKQKPDYRSMIREFINPS
jgi:glycosyltransferase involved in cell wall biosynthesis